MPQSLEILAQREQAALLGAQSTGPKLLASGEFLLLLFEFVEMLLPLRFESACHQTDLRIEGAVPPLGALCFVTYPLDAQSPLRKCGVVISFELFCSAHRRFKASGLNCAQKGLCDCGVNLQTTDIETKDAAAVVSSMSRKGNCWDTQSKIASERRTDLTRAGIGRAALALTCRSGSGVPRALPGPASVT